MTEAYFKTIALRDAARSVRDDARCADHGNDGHSKLIVWMSCDVKLPELGVTVLVARFDGTVAIVSRSEFHGTKNHANFTDWWWSGGIDKRNVTHWAILPTAPIIASKRQSN